MEVIRKGSDSLSKVGPLGCCYPPGTESSRFR